VGRLSSRAARGRGYTYLGVLFIVSLLSMTAALASVVWSTVQRRENERELVFVGRQFAAAIESYHRARSSAPGPPYPRELEQLLLDDRALAVRRHLRQIYLDPMTGSRQWGLIRLPDGGIVGVHSLSGRAPLQRATLASGLSFPLATSYRDWRFIAPSAAESFAATTP
jgi:type II secretory pathway pseudopilin PulG